MIFPPRYGPTGQILSEPWMADDPSYWRTPRTWHTWCRRCNRLVAHDTEAAAEADDQQHGCAAPRPQEPRWTPAEDGILVAYPPLEAARHLPGRSRGAISSRRRKLTLAGVDVAPAAYPKKGHR